MRKGKMFSGPLGSEIFKGVIIALIVGFLVKFIRGKSEDDRQKEVDEMNPDSDNVTLDQTDVIRISNGLLDAMDRMGTRTSDIWHYMDELATHDDLKAVIQEFGLKWYNGLGLEQMKWNHGFGSKKIGLTEWFKAELAFWEEKKMKEHYTRLGMVY